jgi:hypothetical protein
MRDGNCRAGELYRHHACLCVSQLTQPDATTDAPAEPAFSLQGPDWIFIGPRRPGLGRR